MAVVFASTVCGPYKRGISIPEVAHGAAYSGLYRQVVFLYKWSLRHVQVSLYVIYRTWAGALPKHALYNTKCTLYQ